MAPVFFSIKDSPRAVFFFFKGGQVTQVHCPRRLSRTVQIADGTNFRAERNQLLDCPVVAGPASIQLTYANWLK